MERCSEKQYGRLIMGIFFAPVLPSFILLALALILRPGGPAAGIGMLVLLISFPISYLAAFVFGWPMYAILKKMRKRGFLSYSIGGTLIGMLVFVSHRLWFYYFIYMKKPISISNPEQTLFDAHLKDLYCFAIWGVTAFLSFWLIVRPDKQGNSRN